MQTDHQKRIEKFMRGAKQDLPPKPTIPDEKVRRLRARLILEEALETVHSLGFAPSIGHYDSERQHWVVSEPVHMINIMLEPHDELISLRGIADGCADISVVTIGTLSACGIKDQPLLEEVDRNNQAKVDHGTIDEYGKLIKREGHQPPDIGKILKEQG